MTKLGKDNDMKIYKFSDCWTIDLATFSRKPSLTDAMNIHFVLFLLSCVPYRNAWAVPFTYGVTRFKIRKITSGS